MLSALSRSMVDRFRSFDEFWPFYLREHARPATRVIHVAGTWTAAIVLLIGLSLGPWWLMLLAPLIGYGCAWISHLFVERNRPATFSHPMWSLRGDLRLAVLAATGRLGPELRRHGL
ncbi:hypothetical protein SAMN02927895_04668 [Belnapia rosea]|nr:hypothetical protein SAMN02927895_04668 [Belnapia rosea]